MNDKIENLTEKRKWVAPKVEELHVTETQHASTGGADGGTPTSSRS